MTKRIGWIDYAKGIGIILVVYGHVLRGLSSAGMGLSPGMFHLSDSLVYGFHMPLFFLLSGIFAENWLAKYKTANALKTKAFSILWPYLVWSLVQGSVNVFLSDYTNISLTWSMVLKGILLNPFGQFWFLYVLFIQHVLYLVLRRYLNVRIVAVVSLALYIAYPCLHSRIIGLTCKFFIYFCLGALVRSGGMESIMSRIGSRRGLLAAASGFVGVNAFYLWKVHFLQFGAIAAAAGIILAAAISYRLAQASVLRWLQTLGNLSMPIYLMHILCASGTRIILVKLLGTGNVYIHAVLGCAAGIFLPVLFYKAVTKIRANTLLFGR